MRPTSILFLLFICIQSIFAQTIYDYEQKIKLSKDQSALEIKFTNQEDGVELSGTLIYPKKEFKKVIIIVPGSGRDTRHAHFVLAKEFLANGIAVYRFDERGIGSSDGKYNYTATSLESDVIAAFKQLKKTEFLLHKKIGILGHSLGGIASIGALGKGCEFDYLIQMATPVENNGAFIEYQVSTNIDGFYTVKNKTSAEVIHFVNILRKSVDPIDDYKTTKRKSKVILKQLDFRKGKHIVNPLIVDLMKQNHEATYQNSSVPILYIIGTADRIVSSENETFILNNLDNPLVTVKLIGEMNHWLNEKIAPTKMSKSLYSMAAAAQLEIINWTLDQ